MDAGLIPEALLDEAARRFALLGDPTRLRLLSTLHAEGELTTGALAGKAELAMANVSQHLARLMAAGLVTRRRVGIHAHYRIADESLGELCDLVCTSLRARARTLAAS